MLFSIILVNNIFWLLGLLLAFLRFNQFKLLYLNTFLLFISAPIKSSIQIHLCMIDRNLGLL